MKAISVKPTTVRPTRGLQVRSFSANKRSTQILRSNVKPSNLFAKNFTTSTTLLQNRFGSAFGSQVSPSGNSGFSKTEQSAVAPRVFRPEEVDLSKLQFSELKTNQNKGKYVQVLYDGRPLRIQTPAMRAPFGVAKNQFNDEDISFTLALALDHPEANKDVADLQTLLEGVDEAVKNACKANHTSWLPSVPKEKVAATLEINYKSSIRQPTENPTQPEKKYAPTWRVKIPTNRETREVTAPIFGGSKDAPTRITVNDIMKGNRVMVIAELRSVYFVANMLGISWAARQVFVTEKSPNFSDFAFNLKSDSTSKEAEATQGNSKVGQKPLIFKPASSL